MTHPNMQMTRPNIPNLIPPHCPQCPQYSPHNCVSEAQTRPMGTKSVGMWSREASRLGSSSTGESSQKDICCEIIYLLLCRQKGETLHLLWLCTARTVGGLNHRLLHMNNSMRPLNMVTLKYCLNPRQTLGAHRWCVEHGLQSFFFMFLSLSYRTSMHPFRFEMVLQEIARSPATFS